MNASLCVDYKTQYHLTPFCALSAAYSHWHFPKQIKNKASTCGSRDKGNLEMSSDLAKAVPPKCLFLRLFKLGLPKNVHSIMNFKEPVLSVWHLFM